MEQLGLPKNSIDLLHSGSSHEFIDSLIHEIHQHSALNHPYLIGLSAGTFDNMEKIFVIMFISILFTLNGLLITQGDNGL